MSAIPQRSDFVSAYAGQAPWDIGRAQKVVADNADQFKGSVLDSGCGTGEHALFLAGRGHAVTGIDFLEEPIRRAKLKAAERGLPVQFLVKDALTLADWDERFDTVLDSGLFHVFSDADRQRYVAGLAHVLEPGGLLFLLCFSEEEPGTQGPRRVTQRELREAFASGWAIESIAPVRFEIIPNLPNLNFSPDGPKGWFAVIRRQA
jgi:SAM-dependent methyltransferase